MMYTPSIDMISWLLNALSFLAKILPSAPALHSMALALEYAN